MWDVILSILSAAGILLLVLFGLLFAVMLAVLFCPVIYRVRGEKNPGNIRLDARVSWLFGALQVRYSYPEPGTLTARLLWKTVFDSGKMKKKDAESSGSPPGRRRKKKDKSKEQDESPSAEEKACGAEGSGTASEETQTGQTAGTDAPGADLGTTDAGEDPGSGFLGKISRIKYTILKICDRIRDIWIRLTRIAELLQEENTIALWEAVKRRLGSVIRSILPRRFRAVLLFGTGSPDTTGLAFGVYGMLSPLLGQDVCVTPDFTQKILEGNVDISGRITGFVLFRNGVGLLLDKKLHRFLKRLKSAAAWQG